MKNDDFDKFLASSKKPTLNIQKREEIRHSINQYSSTLKFKKRRRSILERTAAGITAIALILLFAFLIMFDEVDTPAEHPSENLFIEAKLLLNENERVSHKDYMLEILIEKEHGQNMIFPYMKGMHYTMTYDDREEEGYYVPSSMGTNETDEKMVVNELIKHRIIASTDDYLYSSFLGFHLPEEAGKYKARMYFNEGYQFDGFDNMYLVYVHKDSRNKWAKLIEIDIEID